MPAKYHAINVANGDTLALIDVTCNPKDNSQLLATIIPLYLLPAGIKSTAVDVVAMAFPFGTSDIYIARDLLGRVGVSKEDLRTQIRYIKIAA